MDLRRRQKAGRLDRTLEDRRRDSERPLSARLHKGFPEGWNRDRRQWLSGQGRHSEGQWPGSYVARWAQAVSRLVWHWRPDRWGSTGEVRRGRLDLPVSAIFEE